MADNPVTGPPSLIAAAQRAQSAQGLISAEQQRAIAEVQARIVMARAQPRDQDRALELILHDCDRLSLAETAVYAFARGGTDIRGPSIRLLESIATRWQNIASGIKILDRRDGYTECASYAWDLENNHYDERQFRVSHVRNTRRGSYQLVDERDIYEAEANAGQRRKRAALEAVIPRDIVEAAVARCEQTVAAKADTSSEGIIKMLEAFAAIGVNKQQIEVRIQRRIDAITPVQVISLRRIYSSLRDGMSEAGDWFTTPPQQDAGAPATGTEALRARLAQQAELVSSQGEVDLGLAPKPAESDPAAKAPEHAAGTDTASAGSAEAAGDPRDQPEQEQGHPEGLTIRLIMPARGPKGSVNWKHYVNEVIDAARTIDRMHMHEFRVRYAAPFNSLRQGNKDEWERLMKALAVLERGEDTDDEKTLKDE